ncbi:lytic transglycosylase [Psychrobacter sanguinis]|uniref:lytic transglycosylase n=1 Tax=Psychrobacter sanguinis TaxID=861445 RepID=UPI0028AF7283|nr:LysM peptidoglycan-binding domain-containing protein [Psychrobacter sanguinis]
MNFRKTSIRFCKLPLVIAIGSVILAGCNSTAPTQGRQQVTRVPVAQNEAVSNVPATGGYSTSLLDDESLSELENLLEATDMKMVEDDKLAIQQYGNLWDRMRAGFRMNQSYGFSQQQRIDAQKNWFISRQEYINRLTARASRYLYHTVREAERRNIPTELALLPVIESSYDPTGTSNAAAAGLWQFIPSTGRIYGLSQTPTYDGRRDVIESTRAAYDFLTSLHNQFGSWELALAAYNAGPGRIQKAIDANIARGLPTDYWSLSLPTETMHYVPRFMAVAQIIKDTNQYSIYLPAIANRQHFRSVPVNYGVSLMEVSQLTGVSYDELKALNPSLTSGRVDSSGPNRVIIPNQVNIVVDSKLSTLKGNGAGISPYTIPDSQYEVMAKSSDGLADFASKARAPQQNSSYIAPTPSFSSGTTTTTTVSEPPINATEKKRIESELAASNTLPTTSAQLTKNVTIVQEPPLSPEEKSFISQQIRQQAPEVGEVVSPVDGNIKLDAIQTQQSILEARGLEKKISFDKPATQQQDSNPPKPTGTRSVYTVQRGDTLLNIATRAGLNWRDIADWNQINPNSTLLAGTKLYLYNAKPIKPLDSSVAKPDVTQSDAQPNTYIVRPGDTLVGTANRVGLSVSRLASYNGLPTNAQLRTGQKLWLIPGMVKETTTSSSSSSTSSAYSGKTKSYTVQRGEGLIGLASRFNVPVTTLAAMNDMSPNEQLLVGQRLTVPADTAASSSSTSSSSSDSKSSSSSSSYSGETTRYTVKSGDTLIGIANKLGVAHTQIADINNFSATTQLQRGQTIKLPVAKEQVARNLNNQTIKYKVQSGDSLTALANKYDLSISDLAKANNLSVTSNLLVGQVITIPGSSGSASSSSSTSSNTSSSSSSSSKSSSSSTSSSKVNYTGTYKVKAGDGLINLAREYGVSTADLAAANDISTTAGLFVGQTLKVPSSKASGGSSSSASSSAPASKATSTSGNYTVKSGDSLIALAGQYGVSVSQLASANGLSNNAQLQIGQKITIPATTTTYKVQSGDSLIGLAKKYGISPQKLAELNGISSTAMLQLGQTIKVPVQ